MADTTTVFLVYRIESGAIRNIFGVYKDRDVADEAIDEIVEEETRKFESEEKREKAAEQVLKKLSVEPTTVRSTPVYDY